MVKSLYVVLKTGTNNNSKTQLQFKELIPKPGFGLRLEHYHYISVAKWPVAGLNVQFAELLLQPNLAKVVFSLHLSALLFVLSGQRGPIIASEQ